MARVSASSAASAKRVPVPSWRRGAIGGGAGWHGGSIASSNQAGAAANRAGFAIAGLVAAGELREAEARAALRSALAGIASRCRDFGAAEATLNRAWQAGLAKPRQPSGSARP